MDALAARGLLPEEERQAARTEAARRLLGAAERIAPAERQAPDRMAPILAVAAPLMAAAVYLGVGAPGFPDGSYGQRLAEWRAAPERLSAAEAAAVLKAITRERPGDAEAHAQLAQARLAAGDAFGAARAAETAAQLQPAEAERWTALAEVLLELEPPQTGEAGRALDRAEALRPRDPDARYWRGRLAVAEGDLGKGRAIWRDLAGDLSAEDPRRAALEAEMDAEAGSSAEVDAAIAGMVAGLAARLEAEPLDPEGWAGLLRAYAVMGREAELQTALSRARRLFANRPEVLADLDSAAAEGRARSGLRAGG